MNTERKPQAPQNEAREEKQTMSQPQEEFIGDEARPSKDIAEVREEPKDVKPAGHQENRAENHEPGVEG
jgi:hypothetical protein